MDGFSGTDYDANAASSWTDETDANAWLGLAIDRTDAASKKKNIMWNLNLQSYLDTMIFNLDVSIEATSYFNVGTASASPDYFTSTDSSTYKYNIDGFMVSTQPSIDILRTSWNI